MTRDEEEALSQRERMRRALVLGALALLAGLLYVTVHHFLKSLAWAVVLSLSLWPVHGWMIARWPKRRNLAAGIMVFGILLLVLLPVGGLGVLVGGEIARLAWSLEHDLEPQVLERTLREELPEGPVTDWLRQEILSGGEGLTAVIPRIGGMIVDSFTSLLSNLLGFAFGLVVCLFATFFLFRHGEVLGSELLRAADALGGKRLSEIVMATRRTVRGVVVGLLLTALAQAVLATAAYIVVGLKFPLLFGVITFFLSFLPIGPPLIWIPAGLWLIFIQDRTGAGIGILLWGGGVVSTVDNVLRPLLIGRSTSMAVLPVFMGVVGGLLTFGMVGVFIGPVVIAVCLELYRDWLQHGPDPLFVQDPPERDPEPGAPSDPLESDS